MLRWKAACGRLIAFVRAHLDVLLLFGTLLGVSSPASAQNCSGQPAANTVCAGPPSGPAGLPSFRAPVSADVPPINLGSSGRGGVTGNLPPGNLDSGTNANAHAYWGGDGHWHSTPNTFTQTVDASGSGTDIAFLTPWLAADGTTIDPTTCHDFELVLYNISNAGFDAGPQPMIQFSADGSTFDATVGHYESCIQGWGANDLFTGPTCYIGSPHFGGFLAFDNAGPSNPGMSGVVKIQSAAKIAGNTISVDTSFQGLINRFSGPFSTTTNGRWTGNTGAVMKGVRIRFSPVSGVTENIIGKATLKGTCGS